MASSPYRSVRGGRFVLLLVVLSLGPAFAQTTKATFGKVIPLSGTPSDIVLDEIRQRLYLVNTAANRVDVYDYSIDQRIANITVGTTPVGAAMSPDGSTLYVTNTGNSTLSVIDLGSLRLTTTVTLPAKPEGVEAADSKQALITTQGSGTGSASNTLLLYDSNQAAAQQVRPILFPPPPSTPTTLPAVTIGRPVTTFRGKLIRTPDGRFIVGMVSWNNNANTYVFVYEIASATILRSRNVTGQSTILSISPDGSRFMAGYTLYDTSTLAVLGQQNISNAPFPMPAAFSTVNNVGGSAFSTDGATLYSAFNTAANTQPAPRPQSSILLISDARNLAIRLGINIPESIIAKMVITADGSRAWGLSESGLINLPLGELYNYPIIMPETTAVFLANDDCNRGIATASLHINNLGAGKLSFNVPNVTSAAVTQVSSGLAPASITFSMEPGRSGVVRSPGTNLYTGATGTNGSGAAIAFDLVSPEAINIPSRIQVYMNYRQSDQRGLIIPIPQGLTQALGLVDMALDEPRRKLYLTNTAYNRVEVFDLDLQRFLTPIGVGQLPRHMTMTQDGGTLYVANSGGESISIVDLDKQKVVDSVIFPPLPRSGTASPIYPETLAASAAGLQVVMSDGTLWKVIANGAVPRTPSTVIGVTAAGAQNTAAVATPRQMVSTADGRWTLLLCTSTTQGGAGMGYLYDALSDVWTTASTLFATPLQGYFGPIAAASDGSYFLAGGLILNSALSVIGGAEKAGSTQTALGTALRNVAGVASVDLNTFVRLTLPVRATITATTTDDARSTLELIDLVANSSTVVGIAPENPTYTALGTTRYNIPPHQLVVDSKGTAYAITLSGLSVIPMTLTATQAKPAIASGARAITNSSDNSTNYKPGSFIIVSGTNLAAAAAADQFPLPTVLGGSCVVFNDVPLPLLQTAPGQISAQIPSTVRPGLNVVQVRSLATAQQSDPLVVTVQKP